MTARTVERMRADMSRAVAAGADTLELRVDLLANPPTGDDLATLLADAPAETILTCRPTRQGGGFDGPEPDRLTILAEGSRLGATFIDVEDDVPTADRPPGRIILSHHDFDSVPADLDAIVDRMEADPAEVNKIAFTAAGPEHAVRAAQILRRCDKPTIALAMGEAGLPSRVMAAKLGAFGTFASLEAGAESAPGQVTVAEMLRLYRWRDQTPETQLFGVVGSPVAHSMSPAIHNAAFDAVGYDGLYVPVHVQPGPENFRRFIDAVLDAGWMGWRGLSVTLPHKASALAHVPASQVDELTLQIGAVNTLTVETEGSLRGDNTDYAAATDSLCDAMAISRDGLAGVRVGMLGAGGVARAIVAALTHYGAEVTIYNRTPARAGTLAAEFRCNSAELSRASTDRNEVLINGTPVGMAPAVEPCPVDTLPGSCRVVFDTIYNPIETALIRLARQSGCRVVTGLDMFVRQAVAQFEIWTGQPAPADVMRRVVQQRLIGA